MSSCLYKGQIEHRRYFPKRNCFTYDVLYYYLNLDEIKSIFHYPFIFSYNFPGILSFWRKDYFGDPKVDLKESIQLYIEENGFQRVDGQINILTNISYFGFCFNPVTFFYCFDVLGTLKFIISEITNTPWGEKHRQIFQFTMKDKEEFRFPKDFHVSPFLPMAIDYTWVFHRPAETLLVLMQNRLKAESRIIFDSSLSLKQLPLTTKTVMIHFMAFPFVTFKTMFAIYWQALKLYIKKVPFYAHPKKGEYQ
jgi:uncharacterized protein